VNWSPTFLQKQLVRSTRSFSVNMDLDKYEEKNDERRGHAFKLGSPTWTNSKCWAPDPIKVREDPVRWSLHH
jgi:hypothetical protein